MKLRRVLQARILWDASVLQAKSLKRCSGLHPTRPLLSRGRTSLLMEVTQLNSVTRLIRVKTRFHFLLPLFYDVVITVHFIVIQMLIGRLPQGLNCRKGFWASVDCAEQTKSRRKTY